jgi:hypothetical protein
MDWQIKYMKNIDTNKRLCNCLSKKPAGRPEILLPDVLPLATNQATGKDPSGASRLISCSCIIPVKLHFPQIVVTVT